MLTLGSRGNRDAAARYRLKENLRIERSNRRGQWDYVDDRWIRVKNSLSSDQHRRMAKTRLSPFGYAEIKVYYVTRTRHRATLLRPHAAAP